MFPHNKTRLSDNRDMIAGSNLIRWGGHYKLGKPEIDHQHEDLIRLLNDLHTQWQDGATRVQLAAALETLAGAVLDHFRDEEMLMERHRYPRFASHKFEHDRFAARIAGLIRDFHTGEASLDEPLFHDLATWLRDHLLLRDKAMGDALRHLR